MRAHTLSSVKTLANPVKSRTLRHVAQYSPLITEDVRRQVTSSPHNSSIKDRIPRQQLPLSQLPQFLTGQLSFNVPVFTVWGACEDVQVLEKLRSNEYKINNLNIIDEAHSRLLDVGGIKLRLLGLGGALVMHKLFDNGEGRTTIAGGQGTMWTTLLQMGELVDTANRVYDPSETRVLVTHASPAREGLLNQLSVSLKVDFSVSAGLHFRYGSSYNEFSVNPTLDHYRGKLAASKASFNDVWETVKSEVEPAVHENEIQRKLLNYALDVVSKMPSIANGGNPFGGHAGPHTGQVDEMAFKNMWNFNLADAAFGWLILEVENGRIGTEMKAQGFNFAHRGQKNPVIQADMVKPAASMMPPPQQPVTAAQIASRSGQSTAPVAAQPGKPTPQPRPAVPASQGPPGVKSPPGPSPSPAAGRGPQTLPNAINGTAPSTYSNGATPIPAGENGPKDSPTSIEKKPSSGIFMMNFETDEDVRNAYGEADRSKIQRIEKQGRNHVAFFSTPEEAQQVLRDANPELKNGRGPGRQNIREYQERRGGGGAGTWGRGGGSSGYRSGGASDSEGGRGGRGGFGRGRGRGSERGPRGGRGGRGGLRGGPGEGTSTSPAPPS